MLLRLFTVYDEKAECYLPPFTFKTRGEAVRAFTESCTDINHQFFKHAADYTLFALGEYDDATAVYTPVGTPESLGKAIEYKTINAPHLIEETA